MEQDIIPSAIEHGGVRRRLARWMWLGLGFVFVGIGGIGIILPGLPTTVFFIMATWCFARSSPRFERWVLSLPRIGPAVGDYRAGLGISRRGKGRITLTILVAITISSVVMPWWAGRIGVWLAGLFGIWFIRHRVPTREDVLAARGHG